MGCSHVNPELQSPKQNPNLSVLNQNIGSLTIKIVQVIFNAEFHRSLHPAFDHLKVHFSNQSFKSFLHHNFSHKSNVLTEPSSFNFTINTEQKQRPLEVQLFSRQELRSEKRIAASRFDMNSIIFDHQYLKVLPQTSFHLNQQSIHMKLNSEEGAQICSLLLIAQFTPEKYETFTIKISSVTLRNYSSTKRKVYFRIQVGQEIYESISAQEDKSKIPSWSDALHTFLVPSSLKEGNISIFEKKQHHQSNILLGQLRLDLKTMIVDENLQSYCEQITLNEEITGTIKFQALKNIQLNDIQKSQIDTSSKIKLEKQHFSKQDDFVTQINSIDTYRKSIENGPTTNFSFQRSKGSSSEKSTHKSNSKNKSSSIYRRNTFILPGIQHTRSAPLTGRERGYQHWLDENIQQEIRRRQSQKAQSKILKCFEEQKIQSSFEKVQVQDKNRIDIMKTSSFLLQNQTQKSPQQPEYELMQFAEFQTLNHWVKKPQKIHQQEKISHFDVQGKKVKGFEMKKQSRVYTSFNRITEEKRSQKKQIANQKLITIENDFQSKELQKFTAQNNSKPTLIIEPGYTEFDLSIKDESNQSQNLNSCNEDIIKAQKTLHKKQEFPKFQIIDEEGLQKINAIKGLNQFIDNQEQFVQRKTTCLQKQ